MLRCKDLIHLSSLQAITVLTGKYGMDNPIRWTYMAENMAFTQWVRGGELLIIGSVAQRPEFDLGKTVRLAVRHKLAGVLFLYGGGYVDEVPAALVSYAKEHAFPLIALPWDVPLVDVMEEIGRAVSSAEQQAGDVRHPLADVLFGSLAPQDAASLWLAAGYPGTVPQCLAVLVFQRLPLQDNIRDNLPEEYLALCDSWLTKQGLAHDVVLHYVQVLLLMATTAEQAAPRLAALTQTLRQSGSQAIFHIGAALGADVTQVGALYEQAQIARRIAYSSDLEGPYIYQEAGIREFILGAANHEEFLAYAQRVLQALQDYDAANSSDYVGTLREYLAAQGNLQRTAERLFVHRNTLHYRLKRIQEITGADLEAPLTRLGFGLALVIRQLH